ncbi:hypothetical protein P7H19_14600 [Paenibacillus larvae]|nr:hypothetical protein [Paenibacillus larvae]MDT2237270.1 hypothetical protein [Paenibacillus larvae]
MEAEFINKPNFNSNGLGKHTATIHAWDEYGEEDKTDKEHNLILDIVVNAVDKSTWKNNDLRGGSLLLQINGRLLETQTIV